MDLQANKAGTYPIYQKPAHAIGLSAPPTPPIGCVLDLVGLPGAGNKIYDRSPYGNHGTITGATWKRLPSGLWALSLDGNDDKIVIPEATSLDLATEVTMEAWFKPLSRPDPTEAWPLMIKGTTYANENYALLVYLNPTSGFDRFYVGTTNGSANILVSDWVIGQWYYAAGTIDSDGDVVAYLDGTNVGTASGKTITANNNDLTIGYVSDGAGWGGTFWANFTIALPRIYNRALSALEIQNHYQQEKHLLGVW